jgi:hypothetical protein
MSKSNMKSICAAVAATVAAAAFASVPSSITQYVPQTINYQGYLANPSTGAAYTDGIYDLDFRLYRTQSGGTPIWGARYSVYVKDGYFNVMLGESGTSIPPQPNGSGTTTYTPTYLWKALWNDTAYSQNYNLWLGVTPRQSATHASITNPTEIAPRQQLLAAPYAFRAQSSYYADQAYDGFTVPGKLTVSGSVSFPSSYSIGGISYSSSTLQLAGVNQTSSNPNFFLYGKNMYIRPYSLLEMKPQAGNIEMTVGNSYSTKISGGTFSVDSPTINLAASSSATLKATSGSATVKSTGNTYIESDNANIYLNTKTNQYVFGKGKLQMMAPYSSTYLAPIKIKTLSVTIPANSNYGSAIVATAGTSDYTSYVWSVVGFHTTTASTESLRRCYCEHMNSDGGSYWRVSLSTTTVVGSGGLTYQVQVLGTHKSITDDARTNY